MSVLPLLSCSGPNKYIGRQRLPATLRNRFLEVQVGNFPQDELTTIIKYRHVSLLPGVRHTESASQASDTEATQLATLYFKLQHTQSSFSMREIVKIIRRRQALGVSIAQAAWSLLGSRVDKSSAHTTKLQTAFSEVWPGQNVWADSRPSVAAVPANQQKPAGVKFSDGAVSVMIPGASLSNCPLFGIGGL